MNQPLDEVRSLFTFTNNDELDAKQDSFSKLDDSSQRFSLGVLLVAALDAVYVIGETLDPTTPQAEAEAVAEAKAAPEAAPEASSPRRRLSLSNSAPTTPAESPASTAPAESTASTTPADAEADNARPFELP